MFVFNGGALLATASGLGLLLLSFVVWRVTPADAGGRAFAAFAFLWGFGVAAGNSGNLTNDPAIAEPFVHAGLIAHIALYVPLLIALARESGRAGSWLFRGPGIALLATPGVVIFLLYLAAPSLFIEDVILGASGRVATQFGILFNPIVLLEGTGIFVLAAVWSTSRLRTEIAEPRRSRVALLAAGFIFFASYRASDAIRFGVDVQAFSSLGALAVMLGVTALGAALACAYAALVAYRDPTLPWRGLIIAGCIVPFLFGLSEIFFDQIGVVGFRTVGLWRLIAAGILAYGIARYRLFDAELRLSGAAPALAYVATTFVAIGLLWAFLGATLLSSPWLGGVATFGVALACVPAATVGRRLVERRGGHVGETDYLYKRKVDVYRAALEDSAARGIGERTEQELLSNLRRALGISEQEHRILLLVIQSQEKYAARASAPTATTIDKFRVERELGRGAHGRALLARDTTLERSVVLKQPMVPWLLDEAGRAKFVAEAKLAARITHPNVVAVYDVLAQTEPPTIVMEYVPGGSLEDKLKSGGKLEAGEAVRLAREMLAGLEAIHAAGMVHRDLKPANVLLDARGAAKISDFGTAQPPEEWRAMATMGATVVGQPGTPAYMSPEQARGEDVDARTDLYAVGAILYRALTGEHYFDVKGLSEEGARRAIQQQAPRLPHANVPQRVEKVLATALAKERAARYADARQMAADLSAALA